MSSIKRREFINTTTLALVGVAVSPSLFANTDTGNNISVQTIAQKLLNAANKRKDKKYNQAINIYNEIIALQPQEIRAYDGKRLTLLMQKNKEVQVINMFQNARTAFPNNSNFKFRLAKEYMNIALGNKKISNQLQNPQALLQQARQMLNQLKNAFPNNIQYQELFEKAKKLVQQNAANTDARTHLERKQAKKNNKKEFKKRFNTLTTSELAAQLSLILAKPLQATRTQHIKEIYRLYIKKLRQENNFAQIYPQVLALYQADPTDVNSLAIARRILKNKKQWATLETIERDNHQRKNTYWSAVALYDALWMRKKKDNIGNLTEIQNLIVTMAAKTQNPTEVFETNIRWVKIQFIQNNITEILNKLKIVATSIEGVNNADMINQFNILAARYYKKTNAIENAYTVINIALKQNDIPVQDEFLKQITLINQYKNNPKPIHNQRLIAFRNKLDTIND